MLKCFHLRRRSSTCQPQATTTQCYLYENCYRALNYTAATSGAVADCCANVCVTKPFISFWSARPLVCEDIQADVEDGQLQFFYILAFILQGNMTTNSAKKNKLACAFSFVGSVICQISVLCHDRDLLSPAFLNLTKSRFSARSLATRQIRFQTQHVMYDEWTCGFMVAKLTSQHQKYQLQNNVQCSQYMCMFSCI